VLANNAPKARVPGMGPTGYRGPRKRVLVVDDVADNRAVVRQLLERLGFEVEEADQGEEALKCIEAQRPDLVLMDILMPVMDGLVATRRLRAMPGCADLPVVVLSAGASAAEKARCLEAGATAFLPKPINFTALLECIAPLLKIEWLERSAVPP
jgi:CheY-like chemotaxis protein